MPLCQVCGLEIRMSETENAPKPEEESKHDHAI
jgi:hypothetical protein